MKKIYDYILKSLKAFDKTIPNLEKALYEEMLAELQRLDTRDGRIAVTVRNMTIVNSIKRKLGKLIMNDEYREALKEFVKSYNGITKLQNEYWRSIEPTFKPRPLLKAIRVQAINDVTEAMTTNLQVHIGEQISNMLRSNITTGGSFADLADELSVMLRGNLQVRDLQTRGILDRFVKTTTITSINQYNRQYTSVVASDLGYTWYRYSNTEIRTSRGFCQSMVQNHRFFHVSQVPELLRGEYLGKKMTYIDIITKKLKEVELSEQTGLPHGFIRGTNPDNFFVNAGGWNCGHSIDPVAERQVPLAIREAVMATAEYQRWVGAQ